MTMALSSGKLRKYVRDKNGQFATTGGSRTPESTAGGRKTTQRAVGALVERAVTPGRRISGKLSAAIDRSKDRMLAGKYSITPTGARDYTKEGKALHSKVVGDAQTKAADKYVLKQPSSAYPVANKKGVDSLERHTRPDGTLTPERQALHDAIYRAHFKGVTPATGRPVAHVMGGGPASGKSVAQSKMDLKNVMAIDVDHIKTQFPEFGEMVKRGDQTVGNFTHEESSLLAKRIAKDAGRQKYNMLLDGSGDGTVEGMIKKIAGYREGGHEIVAHYVTTDVKTAIARSDARGAQTGRYVPHTYLKYLHTEVSKVFPLLAKTGVFDKYSLIDTSGPTPKTVVSGAGIKMTVHEPALYKKFKDKARENP